MALLRKSPINQYTRGISDWRALPRKRSYAIGVLMSIVSLRVIASRDDRGLLCHRLLAQAAASDTLTYNQLRKAGRTRAASPLPPAARALPRSLDLGHVGLPWRSSDRA